MAVEALTPTGPSPTTRGQLARQQVATPPPPPEPSRPEQGASTGVRRAVESANAAAQRRAIDLRFGIHEGSGAFFVTVSDPKTDEVLKTVPPEQLLEFRAALEQALGVLFDREA